MSRNPRNVQQPVVDPAPEEEVDQINPNGGNGEGSSNTFNGAIPTLSTELFRCLLEATLTTTTISATKSMP